MTDDEKRIHGSGDLLNLIFHSLRYFAKGGKVYTEP